MLLILYTAAAFAMSDFPNAVADELGMPCTATCDLCHSSSSGGGTPTQAFGLAMMDRGLTADSSTIAGALDLMVADAVDSDGDGLIDTEELARGRNPNGGADYCAAGESGPTYGCLSTTGGARGGLLVAALGLGLLLRRRR